MLNWQEQTTALFVLYFRLQRGTIVTTPSSFWREQIVRTPYVDIFPAKTKRNLDVCTPPLVDLQNYGILTVG